MRITTRLAGLVMAASLPIFGCGDAHSNDISAPGAGGASSATGGATAAGGSAGIGMGVGGANNPDCTPLGTLPRRVWRLSVEQWGAAVRDLLSLPATPALNSRGGEAPYAFFSDVSLRVDADMQFGLFQASQDILAAVDANVTTALAPCSGTAAADQTACASSFAQKFAQRALRRPLDPSELTNLMAVYADGAAQDYKTGIELVIQALIISPSFMYRTELGPSGLPADASGKFPDTALTPYEVASQLGFTLLGSLPDDALMAAAANGDLATAPGIQTQIDRLLALPQVQGNLTNIMLGWFNVPQLFSKPKDTSLLAALPVPDQDQTAIETDLQTSTKAFVDAILWKGSGKINDLMTSQKVFVNQRLATLYPGLSYDAGAPTSNTAFVAATWPAAQGRSGMLTQPSYLWSASDPALNSIVKRGKQIHDDIVCQDPLGAPVDLSTPQAKNVIACKSPDGTQTLSNCDSEILQSDARMTFQPCKTCHSQMDPYSRVLQNFGPIGNYRSMDEAGRVIDASVTFVPSSPLAPQTLTGVQAFAQSLVTSGVIGACSVQKMASYVIGSSIQRFNTCEIGPLRSQTDGTVKSLFSKLLLADFVRARAGGTK